MTSSEGFLTTSDGLRLFYRAIGSGGRTLVVPNGFHLIDDFACLAEDRRMVVYDVRNRGRSETVADRAKLVRGIEQDVDDLDLVRQQLGVDRLDLLGHSYIGFMVVLYAIRYAAHVNRVVQIGPLQAEALKQYPPHLANSDATLADVMLRLERLQKERPADPEEACRQFWDVLRFIYVTDGRDADRVNWGRCELENERFFMKYWMTELLPSIRGVVLRSDDYAKAQAPVLTIHGTKDRSAPYGGGRDWAAMLPHARLVTVVNAGHAPWVEAPDVVFEAVQTFFGGAWPKSAQTSTRVAENR
jgi:pimeloyl-ACP methyl ester carboxylesterase